MKKPVSFILLVILLLLTSGFTPEGNAIQYASSYQRIISPSPAQYTLFRLNVTYPCHDAKVGEDFNIYIHLWQGNNTSVYVYKIQVWMSQNLTEDLVKKQNLQNPENIETLIVNKSLTVNVDRRLRFDVGIWYSVIDFNFRNGTWTTGTNNLASFHIFSQTFDELTNQVSDLQSQQWGFIFVSAYLLIATTLGLTLPEIQKRRKKHSRK